MADVFETIRSEPLRRRFLETRLEKMPDRRQEYKELEDYILSAKCADDIERLKRGDFFFDLPTRKAVPKNDNGGKRYIFVFPKEQAMLMKLIVYGMRKYDSVFPISLYSFRTSRTSRTLQEAVLRRKELRNAWVIRADVHNYVNSINPEKLIPLLEKLFYQEPRFVQMMTYLLSRGQYVENGKVVVGSSGGLGGSPLGAVCMNTALLPLDAEIGPKTRLYARYSDDIVCFVNTEDEAGRLAAEMMDGIRTLGLEINPEKCTLTGPGEPFDLLGLRFEGDTADICDHTLKKLERKMRTKAKQLYRSTYIDGLDSEEAGKLFAAWHRSFFTESVGGARLNWAEWFFPVITTDKALHKLDQMAQYWMRYCLTGRALRSVHSVPYSKLSELGFFSIVHYYYHREEIEAREKAVLT